MMFIESIESRTLFAGHVSDALIHLAEASSNPAVQATLEHVKADLAAIEEARGGASGAELKTIIDTGLSQLAAGRDALLAARHGDPATREMAITSLKATRKQLKTTIAAARANLRTSNVENRAALREATALLCQDLKQLRADVRASAKAPAVSPAAAPTGGISPRTPTTSTPTHNPPGSGINSTTANGFGGGATGDDILVKYTYFGDADLSGAVDLDVFNQSLNGYQNGGGTDTQYWMNRDFRPTGLVDLDDFAQYLASTYPTPSPTWPG